MRIQFYKAISMKFFIEYFYHKVISIYHFWLCKLHSFGINFLPATYLTTCTGGLQVDFFKANRLALCWAYEQIPDYCLSVSIYPSFKFLSNILSFCTVLVHEILQEYNVIIKTDQCNKAEIERIEEWPGSFE